MHIFLVRFRKACSYLNGLCARIVYMRTQAVRLLAIRMHEALFVPRIVGSAHICVLGGIRGGNSSIIRQQALMKLPSKVARVLRTGLRSPVILGRIANSRVQRANTVSCHPSPSPEAITLDAIAAVVLCLG